MKRPTELTLQPLHEAELTLCLKFLSADLNKRAGLSELVKAMRTTPLREKVRSTVSKVAVSELPRSQSRGTITADSISVQIVDDRLGLAEPEYWLRYALESLPEAQERWRGAVVGPDTASKSDLSQQAFRDLDAYLVVRGEFQLPRFQLATRRLGAKRLLPVLRVHIRRPNDLFDWMFVRAVANSQLSRLARCVICGDWVLKKIAGQRTRKKFDFVRQTKDPIGRWPPVYRHIPLWPALCGRTECKNTFFNTLSGRTPFREEKFFTMTHLTRRRTRPSHQYKPPQHLVFLTNR